MQLSGKLRRPALSCGGAASSARDNSQAINEQSSGSKDLTAAGAAKPLFSVAGARSSDGITEPTCASAPSQPQRAKPEQHQAGRLGDWTRLDVRGHGRDRDRPRQDRIVGLQRDRVEKWIVDRVSAG